jgi:hypothetical protein
LPEAWPKLYTDWQTLNITYKPAQETLLTTPQTLPTSEPATPQISYTVANADLPTLSLTPYQKKWVALIYGGGKFVTAGTLYWRMKKNGASVATGSQSVSANYFYTAHAFFNDVAVGDVLELALWSSVADSNWDYKAYQIQVTSLILFDKPRLLAPCNFSELSTQPVLSLGTPYVNLRGELYPFHYDLLEGPITTPTLFPSLQVGSDYGTFTICYGDLMYPNNAIVYPESSYRPYYNRNYVPTQIILRGVNV